MITISGLWEGKDKNTNFMLSGKMNPSAKYVIVKNSYKRNERDPDYWLMVAKIDKKPADPVAEEEAPF